MATVPMEQVTQRNHKANVSFTAGTEDDAGVSQWLSTTVLPVTVTNTAAVHANYDTPAEILAAMAVLDTTAATAVDLYADFGIGSSGFIQPLIVLGTGSVPLAVPNDTAVVTLNIAPYVTGGVGPLTYEIDGDAEDDFGTSTMVGSVLRYEGSDDGAGADTIPINISDQSGSSVTVVVTATVS